MVSSENGQVTSASWRYGRAVTVPFRLLRDALTQLSLAPRAQQSALAGSVVMDELVNDLDNALLSLQHECDRTGIALDDDLTSALRSLMDTFEAPPDDLLWDDEALDMHPTWTAARRTAAQLLSRLPAPPSNDRPAAAVGDR